MADQAPSLSSAAIPELASRIAMGGVVDVDAPVRFRRQPRVVRGEQRIAWRLGALVLVLSRFNQVTASIESIHLISWALRSPRTRQLLLSRWTGTHSLVRLPRHIDPGLPITLRLAVADGLVRVHGQGHRRIVLTAAGSALAAEIDQQAGLFSTEKAFLSKLGRISDAGVSRVLSGGRA